MTEYCNQNDIKFDYKKLLVSGTSASKIFFKYFIASLVSLHKAKL